MKPARFVGGAVAGSVVLVAGCGWIAGLKDLPGPPDAALDGVGGGHDVYAPAEDASADGTEFDAYLPPSFDASDGGCDCVTVPAGWTGPVALYEGASASPAPACQGGYSTADFQGSADLDAPVASCTACTCGAQTGAMCGAQLTYYTNACGSTLGGCGSESYALNAGVCQGLGTGNGGCAGRDVLSFVASSVESAPGSCAPSTATPNGAAPTWQTSAVACSATTAPAQGWCQTGQVCADEPAAPFNGLCIQAAGAQACPAGTPFTTSHLYYTGYDDTRACGACTCSTPSVGCSASGTVSFWTAFNCTGTPTGTITLNDVNPSTCQALPSMSYYSTYAPTSFTLGSCSPAGGEPSGGVTPSASTAVTFCCIQ